MVAGGGYNWVQTIISIYDAGNLGLAALEPLHHKLRGEVYIDKKKFGKSGWVIILIFSYQC